VVGITNIGNTCFMGADIQALLSSPVAINAIKNAGSLGPGASASVVGSPILECTRAIVTELEDATAAIEPRGLHAAFMSLGLDVYDGQQQMDAVEFMQHVVNKIGPLYEAVLCTTKLACGARFDTQTILAVPFLPSYSLAALVNHEYVFNADPNGHLLHIHPKVLLLQLQRFTRESGQWKKDCRKINFMDSLDLYDSEGRRCTQYVLKGVVYHRGASADSGHYVAVAVRYPNGAPEWYKFDDNTATACNIETEHDCGDAYLFVYERVDTSDLDLEHDGDERISAELSAEIDEIRKDRASEAETQVNAQQCDEPEKRSPVDRAQAKLAALAQQEHLSGQRYSQEAVVSALIAERSHTRNLQYDTDIAGLAMWNDRVNWTSAAVSINRPAVYQLVYRLLVEDPILKNLLKHPLNDDRSTIFVHRPEQSGKTYASVVLAWLSGICYGQAAYMLLRSGQGASADYDKFEVPIEELNHKIWRALVGIDFERKLHGNAYKMTYLKLPEDEYSQRIVDHVTEDFLLASYAQLFMLHSNHLHKDKTFKDSGLQEVLSGRFPFIFSRLATPCNIQRACKCEMVDIIKAYGVDEHGFAKMTLLIDECQQSSKEGTELNRQLYASMQDSWSLKDALACAIELNEPKSTKLDAQMKKRLQIAELGKRWANHAPIAGDSAVDRTKCSHLSAGIRAHVRISATPLSMLLTFEQYDMRMPKNIELAVNHQYYGHPTSKGIIPEHTIEVNWARGEDLDSIKRDDVPAGVKEVPERLQKFCVNEFKNEICRAGFSHILLQGMSTRNNANLFQMAKFFVDYANVTSPDVPVVAITAYMYTTAGSFRGGPWLVFSDKALPIRDTIASVAGELFVNVDKKNGVTQPGDVGNKVALHKGADLRGGIEALLYSHSGHETLANCLQMPKNSQLYLHILMRLLHETVEQVPAIRKSELKLITIGNGVFKEGITPKTNNHKMSVTLGLISATERQINNLTGEAISQGLAGRIAGPRAGDPYWEARGNDQPPRIVASGTLVAGIDSTRHTIKGVMEAIRNKPDEQKTEEAVEQHDFIGMGGRTETELPLHFHQRTPAERKRKRRDDPNSEDKAEKLRRAIPLNSTRGTVGALPAGFATLERAKELEVLYKAADECARGEEAQGKLPRVGDIIEIAWRADHPSYMAKVVDLNRTDQTTDLIECSFPFVYSLQLLTGDSSSPFDKILDVDMNEWRPLQAEQRPQPARAQEAPPQQGQHASSEVIVLEEASCEIIVLE